MQGTDPPLCHRGGWFTVFNLGTHRLPFFAPTSTHRSTTATLGSITPSGTETPTSQQTQHHQGSSPRFVLRSLPPDTSLKSLSEGHSQSQPPHKHIEHEQSLQLDEDNIFSIVWKDD